MRRLKLLAFIVSSLSSIRRLPTQAGAALAGSRSAPVSMQSAGHYADPCCRPMDYLQLALTELFQPRAKRNEPNAPECKRARFARLKSFDKNPYRC